MTEGELFLQYQVVVFIAVLVVYFVIGLIALRCLFPRLKTSAKFLATSLLLAQVAAIVLSEIALHYPKSVYRHWSLDAERNFPSGLAVTQLAVVGGASLLIALFLSRGPKIQRYFFVITGLAFIFLSLDEYFLIHESVLHWGPIYSSVGIAAVLPMAAISLGYSKRGWRLFGLKEKQRWLFACLPAGLCLAAAGALGLEFGYKCPGLGRFLVNGVCVRHYVVEESLEFLGIWLCLVGMLGLFSTFSPKRRVQLLLYVWTGIAATAVVLHSLELEWEAPYIETEVRFETDLTLYAYQVERFRERSRLHIHVHLSPGELEFQGLGYSVSLVDQASLASVASRNRYTDFDLDKWEAPDFRKVYRQWVALDIPSQVAANRALWVVLTVWRETDGDFKRLKVLSSDLPLLSDTQIILDEFAVHDDVMTDSVSSPLARFDNGFVLEAVAVPACIGVGESLSLPVSWHAEMRGKEDFIQFLHFGHAESGEWLIHDSPPLGDRLPTRLWYGGLADSETWDIAIPADLTLGNYAIFTGLYGVRDREREIARDREGNLFADARIPLGHLIVDSDCKDI